MAHRSAAHFALASLAVFALPIAAYAAAEPAAKNDAYYAKKICRVDTPIGGRLGGVRRCRSQAEDDQMKSSSQRIVDRMQTQKHVTETMISMGAQRICQKSPAC